MIKEAVLYAPNWLEDSEYSEESDGESLDDQLRAYVSLGEDNDTLEYIEIVGE